MGEYRVCWARFKVRSRNCGSRCAEADQALWAGVLNFWFICRVFDLVSAVIAVPQAAKQFEGIHRVPKFGRERCAHPYICPIGYWTIGYCHLCDPKQVSVSELEAEAYLCLDLGTALRATLHYRPVLASEHAERLAA